MNTAAAAAALQGLACGDWSGRTFRKTAGLFCDYWEFFLCGCTQQLFQQTEERGEELLVPPQKWSDWTSEFKHATAPVAAEPGARLGFSFGFLFPAACRGIPSCSRFRKSGITPKARLLAGMLMVDP